MTRKIHTIWIFIIFSTSLNVFAKQALPETEYKQLNQAFQLMQNEQWAQAKDTLLHIVKSKQSKLGFSLALYNLGQLELQDKQHELALKYLQQAYDVQYLEPEQQSYTLYTIAQLQCMLLKWQACINKFELWMTTASNISAADHHAISIAYAQQKEWGSVLTHISTALQKDPSTPLEWQQLKVVAHIQLKQFTQAITQNKKQVQQAPATKKYWRQLIKLQMHQQLFSAAHASLRLAIKSKVLVNEKDFMNLASMFQLAKAPFYAAKTIIDGIERGYVSEHKKTLKILMQYQLQAKEYNAAIDLLKQLQRNEYNNDRALQLVKLFSRAHQWLQVEKTSLTALSQSNIHSQSFIYFLAQAQIHLGKLSKARENLKNIDDKNYQQSSKEWLKYISAIEP